MDSIIHNSLFTLGGDNMSNVVESETKELHHELPLMQSFIALLVITVIESVSYTHLTLPTTPYV